MAIKRDKRDILFSLLVRERANNRCEYCSGTGHLECCHVQGRRSRATRWHPQNAVCLCHAHHRYFTERPIEFIEWLERDTPNGPNLQEIVQLSHSTPHYRAPELEYIAKRLKDEYAAMLVLRHRGKIGRTEFNSPYPTGTV